MISLHLNYGEITEKIVQLFLERCHFTHVYTGGAGGYICQHSHGGKPEIGTRIKINKSMNGHGEIVDFSEPQSTIEGRQVASSIHAQIPSIFMETYEWLENARQRGISSVDVETLYIMRAIQNHNASAAVRVRADIGYFVSDYVGEKALRELPAYIATMAMY